jgi:hypothetical protein
MFKIYGYYHGKEYRNWETYLATSYTPLFLREGLHVKDSNSRQKI